MVPASINSRNQSAATLSSPGARDKSLGKKCGPVRVSSRSRAPDCLAT